MSKVIINPSIARDLEINPVYYSENVPIIFKAQQDWQTDISIKMWDSQHKNKQVSSPNLLVIDKIMTMEINPSSQSIMPGEYYFEIATPSRVFFKGIIKIIK